jgi:hypothetical protein
MSLDIFEEIEEPVSRIHLHQLKGLPVGSTVCLGIEPLNL